VLLYLYTKAVFEKFYLKSQLNNCFDILGQLKSFWFDQNTQVQALKEVVGVSDTLLHAINPVYTGKLIEAKYRKVPYVMPLTEAAKFAFVADSVYNWQPHASKPIHADEEEHGDVTYHKVKRGESLGTIAAKYHVSIKQLKKWNHLKRDMIREGQKLKIEK
jgi:membrane-bound lytic murein transglycosylase D